MLSVLNLPKVYFTSKNNHFVELVLSASMVQSGTFRILGACLPSASQLAFTSLIVNKFVSILLNTLKLES